MSDEVEAIEGRIRHAKEDRSQEGLARLQRLYIERDQAQERQFKKSLARRARLTGGKR